jgi:hypothetical protein
VLLAADRHLDLAIRARTGRKSCPGCTRGGSCGATPILTASHPAPLEDIVMRTLAKRPDERPPTAAALADELDGVLDAPGARAPITAYVLARLSAQRDARTALLQRFTTLH